MVQPARVEGRGYLTRTVGGLRIPDAFFHVSGGFNSAVGNVRVLWTKLFAVWEPTIRSSNSNPASPTATNCSCQHKRNDNDASNMFQNEISFRAVKARILPIVVG